MNISTEQQLLSAVSELNRGNLEARELPEQCAFVQNLAELTADTYDSVAANYAKQRGYELAPELQERVNEFLEAARKPFAHHSQIYILEIGPGHGKEYSYLSQQARVYAAAIESSEAFRTMLAESLSPNSAADRIYASGLEKPLFLPKTFHGVFAQASLLHLPLIRKSALPIGLEKAFHEIRSVLIPGGAFQASFKYGSEATVLRSPSLGPRFFQLVNEEDIEGLCNRNHFSIDSLDRYSHGEQEWLLLRATRLEARPNEYWDPYRRD